MGSNPVVFDISSDDEEVASTLEENKGDDYGWFSEVLKDVNKGFDDSDEVVVVGEVNPNKKSKSQNSSALKNVNVEDDDCIVLEGDPEKVLSDVIDNHEDSDELLVVGQKGQVACRDFPHPRHDCAKFPFSSTSHEQHCELCHCFVCDMRAPCCHWGLGISNTDHCHATDKEEIWKTLRKNFRLGRNVSAPPVTSLSTVVPQFNHVSGPTPISSHSTVVPQHNQVPHCGIIRLTAQHHVSRPTPVQASRNCIPQNHVSRPTPVQASRNCIPQNHVSRPTPVQASRNCIPQNHVSRPTPVQASRNCIPQNHVSRPTPVQASRNCIPQNHVSRPSIIRACSSSTRHGVPYNPSVGGRHVLNKSMAQPNLVSQEVLGVHNTVIRRDRGFKVRNLGSQFISSNTISKRFDMDVSSPVNLAPYVPSGSIASARASQYQQNPASVTTLSKRNPNPIDWQQICSDTSLGTYTRQISSEPSMDSVFTNAAPSLSSANSLDVPQSNVHEDTNHVQSRNYPATHSGFSDFDISWVDDIGQSNQQPSADTLQFQTSRSATAEGPFNINEGDNSYYNKLESFLLDSHCTPEGSLTAGLNAPSPPDHISFDTGMLFFDIESSWDHLTRA